MNKQYKTEQQIVDSDERCYMKTECTKSGNEYYHVYFEGPEGRYSSGYWDKTDALWWLASQSLNYKRNHKDG